MACPNKNTKEWKELVNKIGVFEAYREFIANGEIIPNPDNYSNTFKGVNASTKVFNILSSEKGQQLYNKFYKNNPEKFYSELVSLVGKQQTELLKQYNEKNDPQSLNDMIIGILGETGYTVEIGDRNTQYYSNLTVPGGTNYTENEIATPAITPSIKGHAQFSTDKGIGWGRWDEKIQYTEKDIDSLIDILKNSGQLEINCK